MKCKQKKKVMKISTQLMLHLGLDTIVYAIILHSIAEGEKDWLISALVARIKDLNRQDNSQLLLSARKRTLKANRKNMSEGRLLVVVKSWSHFWVAVLKMIHHQGKKFQVRKTIILDTGYFSNNSDIIRTYSQNSKKFQRKLWRMWKKIFCRW